MTSLPPLDELKQLSKDITPGPWRINSWRGICGIGFADKHYEEDPVEKANVELTELAPQLLAEVIRLREEQALGDNND